MKLNNDFHKKRLDKMRKNKQKKEKQPGIVYDENYDYYLELLAAEEKIEELTKKLDKQERSRKGLFDVDYGSLYRREYYTTAPATNPMWTTLEGENIPDPSAVDSRLFRGR